MQYKLTTPCTAEDLAPLKAGDTVLLSGVVYTARDQAHKRMLEALDKGEKLPFALEGSAIYYVGPTPERPGEIIGSAGPTTSGRMDAMSPRLLDLGNKIMIGKGKRDAAVKEAVVRNGAVYLAALGGAGALMAQSVKTLEVIAWPDLGCEAVRRLTVEEMPASSRRYPFVGFTPDREVGKDILFVTDVSKTIDGVKVLDKVSFIVGHGDKIAFVGDNENAHTALFKILAGEMEPDEGTVKWGQTATFSYFPKDNTPYFLDNEDNLVQWLRQFSPDPQEQYLRGFLGRMLFSGDEVYKPVKVLSGGEKVRCMLSRMMLSGANVLMLDQPTNHLDLESIAALNKGLEAVKCNVLVASHDHQLIQTVCNRVFDFSTDGKLTDRRMTYDEYLEKQKEAE